MTQGYMIYSQKVTPNAGTRYLDPFGIQGIQTSEANTRIKIAQNTAKKLFVWCIDNGLDPDTGLCRVTLRWNGNNTALEVLIGAVHGTGWFFDTEDVLWNDEDEISIKIDIVGPGTVIIVVGVCFLSQ